MRAALWAWLTGLSVLVLSCGRDGDAFIRGKVQWVFALNDSTAVEMTGRITRDSLIWHNGGEEVVAVRSGDTTWTLHPFDGLVSGTWEGGHFRGRWTDRQRGDYHVALTGTACADCTPSPWPDTAPSSAWDFYLPSSDTVAMGTLMLHDDGGLWAGTIATPTGDLRFLTGQRTGDAAELHTFDGAHLYHLAGRTEGSAWTGTFHSGTHYAAPFRAQRLSEVPTLSASEAELRPNEPFSMAIYNQALEQEIWDLDDLPKEVTVIDIMGTWCPNCLDEMRTLLQLHREYPDVGFVTVAFERNATADPVAAHTRLLRYVEALDIPWSVALGGDADKAMAQAAFPFLERVASFPTTLFVHRDGRIRTHSGFNGPATGEAYGEELDTFRAHLDALLDRP